MMLQKTYLVNSANILDLQSKLIEFISDGSHIDMIIPNRQGKNGWVIVYTPNR